MLIMLFFIIVGAAALSALSSEKKQAVLKNFCTTECKADIHKKHSFCC